MLHDNRHSRTCARYEDAYASTEYKGSLILGASIIYFINDLYKKRIHACTRDIHIECSKQFK